jgi:hypothetical protein
MCCVLFASQVPGPFNLEAVMKAKQDDPSALHVVMFQEVRPSTTIHLFATAHPTPLARQYRDTQCGPGQYSLRQMTRAFSALCVGMCSARPHLKESMSTARAC